jgi:hypothetical protein
MLLLSHRVINFVVFCAIYLLSWENVSVWAAAPVPIHLDFPATPGRCVGCANCRQNPPGRGAVVAAGAPQLFEHFILQDLAGATVDIYFPMNGNQPTTPDAARWSCANVDANDPNSPITQWYEDAFFTQNFGFDRMNKALPVIEILDRRFLQPEFDNVFKIIAANPVGRVLLYRLLIEIRRQDTDNNGCCETGIVCNREMLALRDASRRINVKYVEEKFAFNPGKKCGIIKCDLDAGKELTCLRINATLTVDTIKLLAPIDIDMFHEMLHWFQLLRHPIRESKEGKENLRIGNEYSYLSKCYYGDISEYSIWDGEFDHREVRVILGTPNYGTLAEANLFPSGILLTPQPNNRARFLAVRSG